MIPSENDIKLEMRRTGFDRLICIRRIQARRFILRNLKYDKAR